MKTTIAALALVSAPAMAADTVPSFSSLPADCRLNVLRWDVESAAYDVAMLKHEQAISQGKENTASVHLDDAARHTVRMKELLALIEKYCPPKWSQP